MAKLITLTIDTQTVSVPAGTLVVDAAKIIGNEIPVFCYHPKMDPVGMCRMCLVEIGRPMVDRATGQVQLNEDGTPKIQFGPKLETSCTTPVSEGMVVRTTSPKVVDSQRGMLEFLLTSHPLDCPICDKGGECALQDLTMAHGPGTSRFLLEEKSHAAKMLPLGDQIILDRERCIHCARCVRFQSEIAGDAVLGFTQRGRAMEIVTFSEPGFDSYFSGNTTDLCPVGALTTVDFRFGARPWELNSAASICTQCPVGCNLTLNVRREAVSNGAPVIKRIMPRQNEEVNEIWICDKGRWGFHYAESPDRLREPLVRKNGELVKASWDEALDMAANGLKSAGASVVTLAGGRLANEDLFILRKLNDALGGKAALYSYMAGGDWTAQIGLPPESNIGTMGPETAILVAACDLEEEAPIWYLRVRAAAERGAKVIVVNPRPTKLERKASQVIRYAYGEETAAVRSLLDGETGSAHASAAQTLAEAENVVVFFGSEGLGLAQSRELVNACADLLLKTNHTGRSNNGLVGVWSKANQQGAWDMGFAPVDDLAGALSGAKSILIAGADPAGDDPRLARALETAGFVVVQELFLTETAKQADVVLPVQSFIEREGAFTSGERRVQRFYPAIPAPHGLRPDYKITADLAKRMGIPVEDRAAARVMDAIAAEIPDYAEVTYAGLSKVRDQWPMVDRSKLHYSGTVYKNRQGLGIQLPQRASTRQPRETDQNADTKVSAGSGEVLLVPVTRLYDRGTTLLPTTHLHSRLAKAEISVHPATAKELALAAGEQVGLSIADSLTVVTVKLNDDVPEGVALVARSVGVPLTAPQAVKIERIAHETAV